MIEVAISMLIGSSLVVFPFEIITAFSEKKPKAAVGLPRSFEVLMVLMMIPFLMADPTIDDPFFEATYFPYLIIPGVHIYYPIERLFQPLCPLMLSSCGLFVGWTIIVLMQGMIGLLIGTLQWRLIGTVIDRFRLEKEVKES